MKLKDVNEKLHGTHIILEENFISLISIMVDVMKIPQETHVMYLTFSFLKLQTTVVWMRSHKIEII